MWIYLSIEINLRYVVDYHLVLRSGEGGVCPWAYYVLGLLLLSVDLPSVELGAFSCPVGGFLLS